MPNGSPRCDLLARPNSKLQRDRTCTGHNRVRSILSSKNRRVDSDKDSTWNWLIVSYGCLQFHVRNYDWTDAVKKKNKRMIKGRFLQSTTSF